MLRRAGEQHEIRHPDIDRELHWSHDQIMYMGHVIMQISVIMFFSLFRLTKPSMSSSMHISSNVTSGPGVSTHSFRTSGSGIGPGLNAGNPTNGSSKYMTARGAPPNGSGTGAKDNYCAMHGYSGSQRKSTGPGLQSKGITEYNDSAFPIVPFIYLETELLQQFRPT